MCVFVCTTRSKKDYVWMISELKIDWRKVGRITFAQLQVQHIFHFFFVRWRTSAKMHTVKCILRQLSIYACLHTVIRMQDWRKIHFPLLINTLNELWKQHKPLAVAWLDLVWRGVACVQSTHAYSIGCSCSISMFIVHAFIQRRTLCSDYYECASV